MEIHLRSALLQGLLLMPLSEACVKLPPAAAALHRWHAFCREIGRLPLTAALSLVKSFEAVSSVVMGVDSLQQWRDITTAWQQATALAAPQLAVDAQSSIIDPRQWKSLA
jgi:aryl-alcohol dehydrogenase-like predicted oxidoreductase